MPRGKSPTSNNELSQLMNVGKATCKDFELLGIETIADLAKILAEEAQRAPESLVAEKAALADNPLIHGLRPEKGEQP